MTFEPAVEVPIEQAGADSCAPADAATPKPQADGDHGELPGAPPVTEAAPLPARKWQLPAFLDHDSQEYEDDLTKRIRETAPTFIGKYEAAKRAAHDVREMKNKLAFDLAVKKAILLGKGGRGSEWGPFVESIGLIIRTVDRWIEQKLDNDELSVWVTERLRATQHAPEQPEPEPEETEAKPLIRFTENRLEVVLPFTADEKAEFVECLRFITVEEAKRLFIEAMRKAAEAKRGLSTSLGVNDAPQRQSLAWLDDEPLAEEKPSEKVVSDVLPQAASTNPAEAFSTLTLNHNIIFGAHDDGRNVPGTLSCLTALGEYVGGALCFPRLGISFYVRPGDLLIADTNEEYHGTVDGIIGDRYSVVAYLHGSLVTA